MRMRRGGTETADRRLGQRSLERLLALLAFAGRYAAFENERQQLEGELLGGPGLDAMLDEMGRFLGLCPSQDILPPGRQQGDTTGTLVLLRPT